MWLHTIPWMVTTDVWTSIVSGDFFWKSIYLDATYTSESVDSLDNLQSALWKKKFPLILNDDISCFVLAQGGPNVARAINCWSCENEWQQDQAVTMKWLFGMSPVWNHFIYRWYFWFVSNTQKELGWLDFVLHG